jgi:hypothetical protein
VALQEMGPRLELALRRSKAPPADLESEAMKQPRLGKKKVRRWVLCGAGVCMRVGQGRGVGA